VYPKDATISLLSEIFLLEAPAVWLQIRL